MLMSPDYEILRIVEKYVVGGSEITIPCKPNCFLLNKNTTINMWKL